MATTPAALDVMFIRQGAFLFAVPARQVLRVSLPEAESGADSDAQRVALAELLALGLEGLDEGAVRLVTLDVGPGGLALEVTGGVAHGALPPERVQPLPPFVAGVRRHSGIGAVFESEERSIGFLLDPGALRERIGQ